MVTTIYLDALFLLNAVMDYCLLTATGKLADAVISRRRVLISAISGGLYGVAAALYRDSLGMALAIQLAASVLMVLLAYGFHSLARAVRIWAVFLGTNFAFGGCVFAISWITQESFFAVSLPTVIAAALLCYAVLAPILHKVARTRVKLCEILIEFQKRECRLHAFLDTGMCVKDPVSNAPVILVEPEAVKPLFSERAYQGLCRAEPDHLLASRFRLIPYRTVGSGGNLLPAFRPDRVLADGRPLQHALVALSPTALADHGEFEALIGVEALL